MLVYIRFVYYVYKARDLRNAYMYYWDVQIERTRIQLYTALHVYYVYCTVLKHINTNQ